MRIPSVTLCLLGSLCFAAACGDPGTEENPEEVITTVQLTFSPAGGGTDLVFEVNDPDGDGGDPPTADPIELAPGDYDLAVGFENRLEDPPEIITEEVTDESDVHQLFFDGTAVDGPASDNPGAPLTQDYDDQDVNDLPIGLADTITAIAGTGAMTVTLCHLPPVNDVAVKTADAIDQFVAGGCAEIGGETDAQVDFDVTVAP